MHRRLASLLHTVLIVAGGLALGQALHLSLVSGEVAITAPVTVALVGGGLLALAAGYRIDVPDADRLGAAEPADPGGEDGFDPDQSPIGETLDAIETERAGERRDDADGASETREDADRAGECESGGE